MILELKDVQAYYDKSHILNGVNLSVEEGTSVCLLAEGVTILIAEQNVKFATKVSSDCYILERGAVVHHQATQDLSEETRKQYLGL